MKTTMIPQHHDTVGSRSLEALLRKGEDVFTSVDRQIGKGDDPSLLEEPYFLALRQLLDTTPAFRKLDYRFEVNSYTAAVMLIAAESLFFDQSPPSTGRRFRKSHRAA